MTDARATDVRAPGRVARVSFVAAYLGSFLLGALVFAFGGGLDPAVATWGNLAIVTVFAVVGSWIFRDAWARAIRLTRQLQAGTVWVNRYGRSRDHILPTGGYKRSGIGKDLGREAYLANRRSKSVLIGL